MASTLLSQDATLHPFHLVSSSSRPLPPCRLRSRYLSAAAGAASGGGGVFLGPSALAQLQAFNSFRFAHTFPHGRLEVRPVAGDADAEAVVSLLAESFSESVRWAPAKRYAQLLAFLVRQYISERRRAAPHAAVLVGFYWPAAAEGEETEEEVACTAEVSLDAIGAPGGPPTPTPPPEWPYVCNMVVKMSLRRRGIGKQLLKACEDLVIKMDAKRRVYLHCRIIDQVPFNMYSKAGYNIVQTDSILVWLSLQKRKYLMCKELPQASHGNKCTTKYFDDNII